MTTVSVQMWMDFGCPWSRMSFFELQRACTSRGVSLDIQFHALRLDANAPSDYGKTTIENLCEHLSISDAEAEALLQKVVDAGNQIGIERTPHFLFSNGVELSGMHYATDFEALVA